MTAMTRPRVTTRARRPAAALTLLLLAAGATGCISEPEAQTCPTGIYCPAGARCAQRQAVCIFDGCGDGVLAAGEVCDDGNVLDADGCSADCTSDETCGNNHVDAAVDEVCDDGNTIPGDKCSADCKSLEECGDGTVDPGENCDTTVESRSCNADCTYAFHGDGKINAAFNEACDGDGAGNGNGFDCQWAGCNANCSISVAGDGWVNPLDGEACDGNGLGVGNGVNCQSSTCNADCTPSVCGDRKWNPLAEECDDGNASNLDDCKNDCRTNFCGDGLVNSTGTPPVEACDLGSALNGIRSCAYGLVSCDLCSETCQPVPLVTHYCGDGEVAFGGELCDDDRSFACGTCGAVDCQPKGLAPARGTITVSSTAIADGDIMVVDDGEAPPVTFEFSLDASCAVPGSACVRLAGAAGATTDGIAGAIRAAFTLVATSLGVQPEAAVAGPNPIVLLNAREGIAGNVPIELLGALPATGALLVTGMQGGRGCPVGAPCFDGRDCLSANCSKSELCKSR
jgi:cysteine-rich repeat protein